MRSALREQGWGLLSGRQPVLPHPVRNTPVVLFSRWGSGPSGLCLPPHKPWWTYHAEDTMSQGRRTFLAKDPISTMQPPTRATGPPFPVAPVDPGSRLDAGYVVQLRIATASCNGSLGLRPFCPLGSLGW